jgi:hypothetical protein
MREAKQAEVRFPLRRSEVGWKIRLQGSRCGVLCGTVESLLSHTSDI